jgi:DnaK suppressor protein
MNESEREAFKKRILSQVDDLQAEIKRLEESSRPVSPDNAIGRLTRMEAINAKSISEANLSSARTRLSRLQSALKRIEMPNFGLCYVCENPIPMKRLMFMPETTRCVDCMND